MQITVVILFIPVYLFFLLDRPTEFPYFFSYFVVMPVGIDQ